MKMMRSTVVALACTVGVLGVACNGGGSGDPNEDTFPYANGYVVDRHAGDGRYSLLLKTIIPHQGEVQGWQPVSKADYDSCHVDDFWREDGVAGCTA